jgi:hypothetical protein
MTTNLKVLQLKGRGLALGEAHGEALRDLIRNHVHVFNEIHLGPSGLSLERSALLELSLKNAWILKRFSPVHYEELEGIAKGSNLPLSDILLINTFLELEDLKAPELAHKLLPPGSNGHSFSPASIPASVSASRARKTDPKISPQNGPGPDSSAASLQSGARSGTSSAQNGPSAEGASAASGPVGPPGPAKNGPGGEPVSDAGAANREPDNPSGPAKNGPRPRPLVNSAKSGPGFSIPFHKSPVGSTSFNVKARASSEAKPLIGQTLDLDARMSPFSVILKITGPDRRKIIILTLAGILGLCGLNDYGIAMVSNKLAAKDAGEGVIQSVLARKCLEQARIGDALGVLALAPRASAMAWQLSGGDGGAFCLETTAKRRALVDFRHSLAHANHFLEPHLAEEEEARGWLTHGGTWVRAQAAQDRLDDYKGRIGVETLKTLCQDHLNNPLGICAHPSGPDSGLPNVSTVAAVIMEPSNAVMHACGPHPCQNVFQTISL